MPRRPSASPGARAVIRLGAIRHNLQRVRQIAGGARVMAVVKANAYGHGLLPVARQLGDADSLAVARLPEAAALRDAGIDRPIVVLQGVYTREDAETARALGLELVVHCEAQAGLLESLPAGDRVVAWLKIDSGMRRLGVEPGEADALCRRLAACRAVGELRLMTHLANADDRSDPFTEVQLGRFGAVLAGFRGDFSVANSAGILGWQPAVHLGCDPGRSWLRAGLSLYGASPFPGATGAEHGLQAAMDFTAELLAVKRVPAGEAVGYGGRWRAERDTLVGIVSAGYGDGYSRRLPSSTPVRVADGLVSLAGRVSMDSAAVDLGAASDAAPGDPVTLWGRGLPVEKVATWADTIPYTLLAGLTHREPPDFVM